MIGGASNNSIDASAFSGSAFLDGQAGSDTLVVGSGHDVLVGRDGDDMLTGGSGNDVIVGGTGSDRLVGSAGNDVLIAGEFTGSHNGSTWNDYYLLRAIGDAWAAAHATDNDLSGVDQDVIDTAFDQLTGSSGADWFIVNLTDKITDANSAAKDGDVIQFI